MRKLFALLSLLVIASMALAACGGGAEQPAEQPAAEQPAATEAPAEQPAATEAPAAEAGPATLRINLGTYPDVIDPQKSSFVGEIAHLKLVYEGLTKFNEKLETVPGNAESWEYNEDATQLTFTLRSGLIADIQRYERPG